MNYRFSEKYTQLRFMLDDLSADSVSRKDLGNLSLPEAGASLKKLKERLDIFNLVSDSVPSAVGTDFLTIVESYAQTLRTFASMSPHQFAQQSGQMQQP